MPVVLGSERLMASDRLRGRRIGVVCNPASINGSFAHVLDRVIDAGAELGAIFAPQHGFRSDVQDNMMESAHAMDPKRRVPIYSLYSETRQPTATMLAELDLLLVDLQDIGARIYTFVYTMANCLRAAAWRGLEIVVCDRPNPIGGTAIAGPMLRAGCESFVGQFPIPMRHGMTIGELARLFNEGFGIGAPLEVIPMKGWRRKSYYDETGLPWVMPSPNVPTLETAVVYPGTVLFEGTLVSEGRGTTRPFELVGAPWIDAERFAAGLDARRLPGVHFRPAVFEPTFQKHARVPCGGCQVHVLDRDEFEPCTVAAALLLACRRASPAQFAWRPPPYEYEHDKLPIDILAGSPELREQIEADMLLEEIVESWQADVEGFRKLRQDFLLYT